MMRNVANADRAEPHAGVRGYAEALLLVGAATLEPLDEACGEMRIIAAATIGMTRLIDNIAV